MEGLKNYMLRIININSRAFLTLGNYHRIITGLFTQGDVVPCREGFVSEIDVPLVNNGIREGIQWFWAGAL